jgi:hypothetical protein
MEKNMFHNSNSTPGLALSLGNLVVVKFLRCSVIGATIFTSMVRLRAAIMIAPRVHLVFAFVKTRFRIQRPFVLFREQDDACVYKSYIIVLRVV